MLYRVRRTYLFYVCSENQAEALLTQVGLYSYRFPDTMTVHIYTEAEAPPFEQYNCEHQGAERTRTPKQLSFASWYIILRRYAKPETLNPKSNYSPPPPISDLPSFC